MNLIKEHNKRYEFFREITGEAMRVHRKYHSGLLESAYEAALKYLLEQKGFICTLPIHGMECSSILVAIVCSLNGMNEIQIVAR